MQTFFSVKKVYFLGTCLADMIYPDTGLAGMRLLEREGVEVIFPLEQSCCGQPAYNAGYRKEAMAVARAQLKAFPDPDCPVVVPSGSCAAMMRVQYPKLFEHESDAHEMRQLASRVYELGDFLLNTLQVRYQDYGAPLKVTWHSSCHSSRDIDVARHAKSLLRQLENVELAELENEDECCGFGGIFTVRHPELSAAMAYDKVEAIRNSQAERVLVGECGCMLNIAGVMDKLHIPVKCQHYAEFLLERIGGENV